jgi:hypothetical protein
MWLPLRHLEVSPECCHPVMKSLQTTAAAIGATHTLVGDDDMQPRRVHGRCDTHLIGAGELGVGCSVIILAAVALSIGQFAIPLALLWAIGLAVAIWRAPSVV